MDSLKAAEEQRPNFAFSGCHHHPLELSNFPNKHLVSCSGCTLPILGGRGYCTCWPCSFSLHSYCIKMPISLCHPAHELRLSSSLTTARCRACPYPSAPVGGSVVSYKCQFCPVHFHFHSLCLLRPVSISCYSDPLHDLSLKFHAEFSSVNATVQKSLTAGSLGCPAAQPTTPSTAYPPLLLLTAYRMPHQESTVLQLQQLTPSIIIGMGTSQAQPQFDGFGYQLSVGNGDRIVPVAPGMRKGAGVGIGTPLMAGVGSGIEEGIGQELIPSTAVGFGHKFFRLFGSEVTPTNSWEHRLLYLFLCFSVFLFVYLGYSTELSIWNL